MWPIQQMKQRHLADPIASLLEGAESLVLIDGLSRADAKDITQQKARCFSDKALLWNGPLNR
jgi:hypothetical protein